jgi:hypothetical protein
MNDEPIRYVVTGSIELEVEAYNEDGAYETASRILDGIGVYVDPMEGLHVYEAWTPGSGE